MSDIIAVKWNVIWRRQRRCAISRTVRLDAAEWRGTSSPVLFFSSSVPGRLLFSHRLGLLDNVWYISQNTPSPLPTHVLMDRPADWVSVVMPNQAVWGYNGGDCLWRVSPCSLMEGLFWNVGTRPYSVTLHKTVTFSEPVCFLYKENIFDLSLKKPYNFEVRASPLCLSDWWLRKKQST